MGSALDPEDLWFRDDFINLLWEILRTEHVLLTAPRRTGKTSVRFGAQIENEALVHRR